MDAQINHLEARHAELFAVLAELNAGLKHGTVRSLDQVREIIAPVFPELRRADAPQNPTTLICLGKAEA